MINVRIDYIMEGIELVSFKNRMIALTGVLAALAVIGTMIIQIPIPMTKGFIHIGDSIVYLCGILLSPAYAAAAAGIGSALADVLSGYLLYAPATFVIKALDAVIAGFAFKMLAGKTKRTISRTFVAVSIAVCAGGLVMVSGYFAYEAMLFGGAAAIAALIPNIIQAVGGGVILIPILLALDKMNLIDKMSQRPKPTTSIAS